MDSITRRAALKKAGIGGAVLWATPALVTQQGSAFAGSAPPEPACNCQPFGFGLDIGGTYYASTPPNNPCVASVSSNGVTATTVCGSSRTDPCNTDASVASVRVVTNTTPAHTIDATGLFAHSDCGCCTSSATSGLASLVIDGEAKPAGTAQAQYVLGPECTVFVNTLNFSCGNGRFGGQLKLALWITTPGVAPEQVRVAYASTACAPDGPDSCCDDT